jgi:hypothetical protein
MAEVVPVIFSTHVQLRRLESEIADFTSLVVFVTQVMTQGQCARAIFVARLIVDGVQCGY